MARRRTKKPDPFKGPYKYHPHTGEKAPWGIAWYWVEAGTVFGSGRFQTETARSEWLQGRYSDEWGLEVNPTTGEKAPPGRMWINHLMNQEYVLTSVGEPYTLSVASETYWST